MSPTLTRRGRRVRAAAVAVAAAAVVAATAGVSLAAVSALRSGGPVFGPDEVPAEYRSMVRKAAQRCPAVPVTVFAAQLAQESGWDPRAESPAGAQGLAQFLPATWDQFAVDGDGDGERDVWNPADAIASAAELNCVNRDLVAGVPGERLPNILAAYNAGHAAVRKYGGVPPFPETENYVARILARAQDIRV